GAFRRARRTEAGRTRADGLISAGLPGGRRFRYRRRKVEFHPEKALRAGARQFVYETFARLNLHGPDIVHRGGQAPVLEQPDRLLVDRELLPRLRAIGGRFPTVHGHRVLAAVFVAMIVFQADAVVRPADNPGTAAVISDVKRNPDLVVTAITDVHYELPARERIVVRRRLVHGYAACVRLPAMPC